MLASTFAAACAKRVLQNGVSRCKAPLVPAGEPRVSCCCWYFDQNALALRGCGKHSRSSKTQETAINAIDVKTAALQPWYLAAVKPSEQSKSATTDSRASSFPLTPSCSRGLRKRQIAPPKNTISDRPWQTRPPPSPLSEPAAPSKAGIVLTPALRACRPPARTGNKPP